MTNPYSLSCSFELCDKATHAFEGSLDRLRIFFVGSQPHFGGTLRFQGVLILSKEGLELGLLVWAESIKDTLGYLVVSDKELLKVLLWISDIFASFVGSTSLLVLHLHVSHLVCCKVVFK